MALSPLQTGADPSAKPQSGDTTGPSRALDGSIPASNYKNVGIRRGKRRFVAMLKARLEDADARMVRRLCQAFGKDGSDLVRDLIREKYAELYESIIEPEDVSEHAA